MHSLGRLSAPHFTPGRKFAPVLVLFVVVGLICLLDTSDHSWKRLGNGLPAFGLRAQDLSAANSTLGFGAIVAIGGPEDKAGAWRKDGLRKAANRTGLSIQIPPLPTFSHWELGLLTNAPFNSGESNPRVGEALAWLGHLHILRSFLSTDLSTVFIIEDDVDWDLAIRYQTSLLAPVVRNFTSPAQPPPPPPNHPRSPLSPNHSPPYGLNWDLLWLGHCGDNWHDAPHRTSYQDPTTLPAPLLKGFHHDNLPNNTRILHSSIAPLCSFAYAVTRAGAAKLLAFASPTPPAHEGDPLHPIASHAYDLALQLACSSGGSAGMACWTVNPELMHHQRMGGRTFSGTGGEGGRRNEHTYTWNLGWSARCNWDRWGEGEAGQRRCLPMDGDP